MLGAGALPRPPLRTSQHGGAMHDVSQWSWKPMYLLCTATCPTPPPDSSTNPPKIRPSLHQLGSYGQKLAYIPVLFCPRYV